MLDEVQELTLALAVAVGLGGLIGLERERWVQGGRKRSFGGARTFPLIALCGALSALLSQAFGGLALLAGFAAVAALIAVFYGSGVKRKAAEGASGPEAARDFGLTTEIAALLVFGIAALPLVEGLRLGFQERLIVAAGLGAVVLALLSLRERSHALAGRLSAEDVRATVQFVLLAVVVLPLLPNRAFPPYQAINPFGIGVVVALVAGISYVGYVAVRALGARRGIGLTALAGGLVSSTAVTLTFSGRARQEPRLATTCALAVVLASTIMFPRVGLELAVIEPALLEQLLLPLAAMILVGALGCGLLWRRAGSLGASDDDEPAFRNPFSLGQALKLGLAYVVVRVVAAGAHALLGSAGLIGSALLAGISDVDAITISVGRMYGEGLSASVAVLAVIGAVVSNTLTKIVLAFVLGGRRLGLQVAAVLLPAVAAGLAVALLRA